MGSNDNSTASRCPERGGRTGAWLIGAVALLGLVQVVCGAQGLPWRMADHYREAALARPSSGKPGFTLLAPSQSRVTFTNVLAPQAAAQNQILLNGSGVAAGDVDGDGWCDLYFCGLQSANKLFRNVGQWTFLDVTEQAGVACTNQFSTGAAFADIDGDGDLDLLVNGVGVGTRCFTNDGQGRFTEMPPAGLVRRFGSTSLALADIDGDGDLDLYVANYRTTTIRSTGFAVLNMGGKRIIRPEDRDRLEYTPEGLVLEHGEVDYIYLNDGGGRFTPMPWTGGTFLDEEGKPLVKAPFDWGLTVQFRDLNRDRAPDIYVSNDFHSPDRVWINDQHGKFRALETLAIRRTPTFSMAVDFADLDRDGHDDFVALDMLERTHAMRLRNMANSEANPPAIGEGKDRPQIDRNSLQWNRGDGTYADIAQYAGLEASGWSWSLLCLDADLDGYEDVFLTTGNLFNTQDLDANERIAAHGPFRREMIPSKLLMYPPLLQPKLLFRNRGDLTFEELGGKWGFGDVGVAQGMALADLDNDGDLDVVVNNLNGPAGLYRNDSNAALLAVRLKGKPPNTRGIGARIIVSGGPVTQSQEMIAGGRYLSSDDTVRVFAAGNAGNHLRIEVEWRGGKESIITNARANHLYEIDEAGAEDRLSTSPREEPLQPWFDDVSHWLNHKHHEEPFDDFARQPLLPNKLSQLGPGTAWFDLDGDGWEDLVVGSGKGGKLAAFRNTGKGFLRMDEAPFNQVVTRDQTGLLGWRRPGGSVVLLAGSANYEDGLAMGSSVRQYDVASGLVLDTLPGQISSTGPLALGDVEGDGVLELFVGGRVIGGNYPQPASSWIFKNVAGKWVLHEDLTRALRDVGLVSSAIWSDLNNDGFPELVLACEWGPVRVFANHRGILREATRDWGLDKIPGWWNGVAAGDFDGDGRLDLVASNWGLNTLYQASSAAPRRLYYGDLNGNGTLETLEAHLDAATQKWVPQRDLNSVAAVLPFIRDRFPTHEAYAQATIQDLWGEKLAAAKVLDATELRSALFLNRGSRFEIVPLPPKAQFSPGFGIAVADFDGDGAEDIFLAQNFFATQPQVPRNDAGRGLLLRGDGSGRFVVVPGSKSGVRVYGEQRGCAWADYDHDGRVDLVVSQNGAATKLFHNRTATPGLRVRLRGPAGNPHGVGAGLRLHFGDRSGPLREVHAGSGYWSQNSAVQVMASPEAATALEVRWPGGRVAKFQVPAQARSIEVTIEGKIRGMSE